MVSDTAVKPLRSLFLDGKSKHFMLVVLLALVAVLFGVGCRASGNVEISCLDSEGSPVEWWFILKFPGGGHFAYLDSTAITQQGGARP